MHHHTWSWCEDDYCIHRLTNPKENMSRVSRSMPVFFYRDHISTLLQLICIKLNTEIFLKMTRPGWHSTTPLVMGVPENSPRVAPEKRAASDNTSSSPNIVVSEFYFWRTITPEANVREAPNLERTVSWEESTLSMRVTPTSGIARLPRRSLIVYSTTTRWFYFRSMVKDWLHYVPVLNCWHGVLLQQLLFKLIQLCCNNPVI